MRINDGGEGKVKAKSSGTRELRREVEATTRIELNHGESTFRIGKWTKHTSTKSSFLRDGYLSSNCCVCFILTGVRRMKKIERGRMVLKRSGALLALNTNPKCRLS